VSLSYAGRVTQRLQHWRLFVKGWDPELHPRDEGGRFTDSESVPERAATATLGRVGSVSGGYSVQALSGRVPPPRGFMVGGAGSVKTFTVRGTREQKREQIAEQVADYVAAHREELSPPEHYLGLWRQPSGKVFMETSQRVPDRNTATTLGGVRNQISIWDLANKVEISTGGSGKAFDPALHPRASDGRFTDSDAGPAWQQLAAGQPFTTQHVGGYTVTSYRSTRATQDALHAERTAQGVSPDTRERRVSVYDPETGAPMGTVPNMYRDPFHNTVDENRSYIAVVRNADGTIRGGASYGAGGEWFPNSLTLSDFHPNADAERGQGAGRALLEHLATVADARGMSMQLIGANVAPEFYSHMGFDVGELDPAAVHALATGRR
jgi:GNAT superfamily N-acetyltransferase